MRHCAKAIELGDDQGGACRLGLGERLRQLGAIRTLARFDLDILGEQLPLSPVEIVVNGFALRLDPEAGQALLLSRHSQIADEFAARHSVPEPRFVRCGDLYNISGRETMEMSFKLLCCSTTIG
jgi:hypothetical protein